MIPPKLTQFLAITLLGGLGLPMIQSSLLECQTTVKEPLNVVIQIDGQLKLKRTGWTIYTPVVFGTNLHSGDLLDLRPSSNARVVCSDLTLHPVGAGIGAVPCSASRPILSAPGGSLINPTRGWPSDGTFPIVVSPRKTKLISTHPTLRWTPVKGATAYTVAVRGPNLYWSTSVTSGTEVGYPEKAPKLEVGVDYKLLVAANNGPRYDEPGLGLGFSLLSADDRRTVLREQKQIENLGLAEGPTQFLIAHLYASQGLYAEAVERLEAVSQRFRRAAVQRLLGDLYIAIGLPRQAETNYLSSLELATAEDDEEGQMRLHAALGYIYGRTLGNKEAARQHLNAVLALARKLGDEPGADHAAEEMAELKNESPTK